MRRNSAPSAPSIARWSQVRTTCIIGAISIVAVDDDGRVLHGADGEDRDLRRVEHGDELLDAEHAEVRDRERAALHVGQGQLAVAGAADEVRAGAGDLLHAPPVGVTDDRDDEPVRRRDRHADVRGRVRWTSSPAKVAFSARCCISATPTSLVRRSLTVGLTSPSARRATSCSRRWSVSDMSIDTLELEHRGRPGIGEPACDRLAGRAELDDLDLAARRERSRGSCAAGGWPSPAPACSTSSARIRPSGPVPAIALSSSPRSRAMRRASGEALILAPAGASETSAWCRPVPGVPGASRLRRRARRRSESRSRRR